MSERKIIRVREVMKRQFDMVDGIETVKNVLTNMKYPENKCFIVQKRHADDEYGILLLSDVAREVLAKDRAPDRVNVYEVMSKPVIGVDLDMDIRYCARLFARFEIARAPVIDKGEVVGIVSFTDLVLRGLAEKSASH